jgi:Spy/CpxP family protein refolding chaperone
MSNKFIQQGLVTALLVAGTMPILTRAQEASQAPAQGQEHAAPAQKPMDRPNLNLTDDQKAQIKKIHEEAKSQVDAINNDSSLSADQKQAKIREVRKDSHKQVEAMLTPEQRKTMKEWRHEHRGEKHQQEPPSGN